MKSRKKACQIALLFLGILPVLFLLCVFALQPQYDNSFLGELKYKKQLLQETDGPRIILVGGSAAVFGVDSALLSQAFQAKEREVPDAYEDRVSYTALNFGMYAGLGTCVTRDLSLEDIREGDLVIWMPEQQEQALSEYLGAEFLWQAADGDFSILTDFLREDRLGTLLSAMPSFAISKLRAFLEGGVTTDPVYNRQSFNALGDIENALCALNRMPGGVDTNTPIRFDEDVYGEEWLRAVNAYAKAVQEKGATIWYHFPPMNAAALAKGTTEEQIVFYQKKLAEELNFPVLGDARDCLLDSKWFYDTNFHLNASGKELFTSQLIRDIKAELGDASYTEARSLAELEKELAARIALSRGEEKPGQEDEPGETVASAAESQEETIPSENGESAQFEYEIQENGAIRLTALSQFSSENLNEGSTVQVPASLDGKPVEILGASVFAGNTRVVTIILPDAHLLVEDGAFDGCLALKKVVLTSKDPGTYVIGQGLLSGTSAMIYVPKESLSSYRLNYSWAIYAAKIREE
ncbi:MAG: hypothetical protein IJ773_02695 [Lachnospiraceae bacterium]|nr:hypothetical protein [Lachnospiraceae bacterium]